MNTVGSTFLKETKNVLNQEKELKVIWSKFNYRFEFSFWGYSETACIKSLTVLIQIVITVFIQIKVVPVNSSCFSVLIQHGYIFTDLNEHGWFHFFARDQKRVEPNKKAQSDLIQI